MLTVEKMGKKTQNDDNEPKETEAEKATETCRLSVYTTWLIDVLAAHTRSKSQRAFGNKHLNPFLEEMYRSLIGKEPKMPD